jgi:putative protease
MVELLSPARDLQSLSAALNNGADSVYIGMQGCNMRANVSNFSLENIKTAVKKAQDFNSRLYVCTNTILKDNDFDLLEQNFPILHEFGVDAVIVADLGAVELARENDLEVHLSVQANISNSRSLNVLKKLGVSRTILSRELSLSEISYLAENSPIELEVFVHGALCMAVSGRCFLSSHLYGKSANCGECLQPCRKNWKIISQDNEEFILDAKSEFSVDSAMENLDEKLDKTDNRDKIDNMGKNSDKISGNEMTHFLSPRDLCMVKYIPQLIESGVDAFKIEGRARPADYVATVTRVYREAIGCYENGNWEFQDKWLDDLKKVFNRGFDQGLYFNNYHQNSPYNQSTYIKKDIGQIVNYFGRVGAAEIRLWDDLNRGDEIIIQGPTTGSITHKVKSMEIEGKTVVKALKNQHVGLLIGEKVRPNDLVYKRVLRAE